MRTSSSTLTSAQVNLSSQPIWKVVLSRSAQSTRAYDNTRVLKISQRETPKGDSVELVLNNSDGALTSLDFEHYQAIISIGYNTGISRSAWVASSTYAVNDIVIPTSANTNGYQYRCSVAGTVSGTEPTWPTTLGVTVANSAVTWEMDGNTGNEYSRTAPLRVRVQELHSGRGVLKCILRPQGILDQLSEDKGESKYTQEATNTSTVQDLVTSVAGASLAPYANYTAYTVSYDSTDGIIGTFVPAEYFRVNLNENRLDKIQELLDYTGCKMRPQNDGQIHVFDPVTAGTAYDYEYALNVAGTHQFWNESVRLRFVHPNRVIVTSPSTDSPLYAGTATSTTSYDLAPKTYTLERRLVSTAQASSIASAVIERNELDAEVGFAVVPMNVGQELWDYVRLTDSRLGGTTRVGNVQFIQRDIEVHPTNQPLTWRMMISYGKVTEQSLLSNLIMAGAASQLSNEEVRSSLLYLQNALFTLQGNQKDIVDAFNKLLEDATFRKVHVVERLKIPVWTSE